MSNALAHRQSAIAAASCLKRYHAIYELGMEDDSDESRRGSAFHRIALEEYVPALVAANTPRDAGLLERAFRAGIVAAQCPPHLVDEVEDLVFAWGADFELDLHAFLLAEERQASGGVSWKPDLTFAYASTPEGSKLRVRDLKTWYALLSEDAVRALFQGQFYIWQAMQIWPGFDVYEFEMEFVRYRARVAVQYTADDLARLERKVKATIATIDDARARDAWPAQPGEHCGYCRLKCDVVDDDRCLDRRILTAEEAAIVAGRRLVLERLLAMDTAALKAWSTTEGPVVINGLEFAHRKTERVRYYAPAVIGLLNQHDVPIPPDLTISKSALRPILGTKGMRRRKPELVDAIEQIGVTKIGTKFGAKKIGDRAVDQEPEDAAE